MGSGGAFWGNIRGKNGMEGRGAFCGNIINMTSNLIFLFCFVII